MFGRRFFGARFYGERYYGPTATELLVWTEQTVASGSWTEQTV